MHFSQPIRMPISDLFACSVRRRSQCLIILGALLFSAANASVKLGNELENTSSWALMAIRGVFSTFFNACFMYAQHGWGGVKRMLKGVREPNVATPHRSTSSQEVQVRPTPLRCDWRVYMRGLCGSALSMSLVFSFTYLMTFADAFSIYVGGSTVMGLFFATCFLGEKLRPALVVGGLVTIIGVVLVAKPTFLFETYIHDPTVSTNASVSVIANRSLGIPIEHRATNGTHPHVGRHPKVQIDHKNLQHHPKLTTTMPAPLDSGVASVLEEDIMAEYRPPTLTGVCVLAMASALSTVWCVAVMCCFRYLTRLNPGSNVHSFASVLAS